MQMPRFISVALFLLFALAPWPSMTCVAAEEVALDLSASDAVEQWRFLDPTARMENGELILDGRRKISRAVYRPVEWSDVTLKAQFFVEPQPMGVLACGFIVRAIDASTYYYVHFDRQSAILVRHSSGQGWNEIHRVTVPKPPGEWHDAELQCEDESLRVSLNGRLLFEAKDKTLSAGRIGFYGSQGLVRVRDIRVSGESRKPSSDFVVPPPTFTYVCEDAGAGGYEAFPDVCRLNDGRLMCVFYAGYGHVALPNEQLPKGGRIAFCVSSDEGKTWSPAETLYDGPDDDRDPSIVQLRSGRMICNFFSLRRNDIPKQYSGLGTWIIVSDDQGKSWSAPRQISTTHYCSSPIRELSSGRLILGLYTETGTSAQGSVVFSDDQGVTWQPEVLIDNNGVRLDAETDLIELKDGALYAAQRPQMAFSTSHDKGVTWTVSKAMGFAGHCPYFLRTHDDVILLAFRLPHTSMRFSRDEGETWSDNVVIDEVIGAYPSMVNLSDGSVLVVYYEEGSGSSIRSKRFRVTEKGIEWMAPFITP